MRQIKGKSVLLRVSEEFELPRIRVIGVQLWVNFYYIHFSEETSVENSHSVFSKVFSPGVFLRGFFSGFPGLILPLKATFHIPIRSRNSGQEEPLTEYPLLNSHLFLYIL